MRRMLLLFLSIAVSAEVAAPTYIYRAMPWAAATSAIITWTTAVPANSKVKYGTTTSYGKNTGTSPSMFYTHYVTIPNLTRSTFYHFRVMSADSDNVMATSLDYTFQTVQHAVILQWQPSQTPDVTYVVYKSANQTGPWSAMAGTSGYTVYVDKTVQSGQTAWYQVTASFQGVESVPTAPVKAVIP